MTEKLHYDFDLRLDDPVSTHALQFQRIPEGVKVLDVGCHTGILGEALKERKHCEVIGIDNDNEALAIAAGRLDIVQQVDLEHRGWSKRLLEVGLCDFDVILFGDVIEHTRGPRAILEEAHSLLKPGGQIIVSLPNVANLRVRLGLLFGKFDYTESGILDESHLRFFTLKSARELVINAGYHIVNETYSGYSLPRWLIDLFPTLLAVNIIITARACTGKLQLAHLPER
jgi:2-polyprenyl-3-methyl-5-hydroxy-6-metoxy-1,4-benzoquinol methylase